MYTFRPEGVCSDKIELSVRDGKIESCEFTGGCAGSTKGICALVAGMDVQEAIDRLAGIMCGGRGTSCPDQLAKALRSHQSRSVNP